MLQRISLQGDVPIHAWAAGSRPAAYLVMPFSVGDCPMVVFLRNRSFTSITRRQVIVSGSMSNRTNLRRRAAPAVDLVPAHARLRHLLISTIAGGHSAAVYALAGWRREALHVQSCLEG